MTKKQLFGNIILFLGAFVWGLAFLFQNICSDRIGPFTLNALRCTLGYLAMIPLIAIKRKTEKKPFFEETKERKNKLAKYGIISGLFLCAAINLQQFGITLYPDGELASTGRSGFITSLYVVLVPILEFAVLRKKLKSNTVIAILIAIIGIFLLCANFDGRKIYLADIILFFSALGFALQILVVDKFAKDFDALKFNSVQFKVCAIITIPLMFIFEEPSFESISSCKFEILYLGLGSTAIGYYFQILGEQYSKNPSLASIIMSLESVFALLAGVIVLHEILTIKESIGCLLIFIASIIPQLNFKKNESIE